MIKFQENTQRDVRGEGWTDPFHRILPATAGGLTKTTAVAWQLKVKDKKCDVSLNKNYCIAVTM